jgi:hypothetical protein
MVSGIRYSYSNGGSVDIKYPKRQGFDEGSVGASNVGLQSSYGNNTSNLGLNNDAVWTAPQADNSSALSVNVDESPAGSGGGGATGQPGQASNYATIPTAQTPQATSSTGAGGLIGGLVDDVVGIFGVGQNAATAEENRNIARKQYGLQQATTAENLRGAGQSRQQSAITFGENQQQRGVAAAWASGVVKGLTTAKT